VDTTETERPAPRTGVLPPRAPSGRGSSIAPIAAGVGLALAGVLHVLAAVGHRESSAVVVGFFLIVALGQVATAAWFSVLLGTARRPAAWQTAAVLGATVVLVGLYLVAHTTDLLAGFAAAPADEGTGLAHGHDDRGTGPVGLGQEPGGTAEQPGLLGSAAVLSELAATAGLLALLPLGARRRATDGILVVGLAAWVLWWTGVLR
jgi:hypothetical protein